MKLAFFTKISQEIRPRNIESLVVDNISQAIIYFTCVELLINRNGNMVS